MSEFWRWVSVWSFAGTLFCAVWCWWMRRQARVERAQYERDREMHELWWKGERLRFRASQLSFYDGQGKHAPYAPTLGEPRKTPLAERSSKASPSPLPPPLPSMIAERPDPKKQRGSE
jgi:hypothetical protein